MAKNGKNRKNGNGRRAIVVIGKKGPFRTLKSVYPMNISLRFNTSSPLTGDAPIYRRDLINLLFVATSSTTASSIIAAIKINHIRLTLVQVPGSTTIQTSNFDFQWTTRYGPSSLMNAVGNPLHPATVSTKPPNNSLAGVWTNTDTDALDDPLFTVACASAGLIVDINFDFTMAIGVDGATTLTTSAASTGVLYVNRLDNSTAVGTIGPGFFQPTQLNQVQAWG